MDSSPSNPDGKQQSRDYKCACEKTYLSNAAVFTHIKQKHNGVVVDILCRRPAPYRNPKRKEGGGDGLQPKLRRRCRTKHLIMGRTRSRSPRKRSSRETVSTMRGSNKYSSTWGKSGLLRTSTHSSGRTCRHSNAWISSSRISPAHRTLSTWESASELGSPSFSRKCRNPWSTTPGSSSKFSSYSSCCCSTQSTRIIVPPSSRRRPWRN